MKKNAIFTIISKNYISYARVLMDSFLKYHSDCDCYVLLVDKIEGYFDPSKENFQTIELEQVEIPNRGAFIFKYDIMELNTAVKPFFFEYLLRNYGYDKVIYFDPDILILKELSHPFEILDNYPYILIPHFTSPLPDDDKRPNEIDIIKAGCYNLGFLGISNYGTSRKFLEWWQDRLYKYCFSAPEIGLFVDQKWIDLVPSLYNGVYILKHPGYNVAYWNLHERHLQIEGENYRVNGEPLYFYHFSGIELENIRNISKYQDRYHLDDIKNLEKLFRTYRKMIFEKGYRNSKQWPYYYGYFDNRVKIPKIVRRIYHEMGYPKTFGNPYETTAPTSFFRWLNSPVSSKARGVPRVTHLVDYIYQIRPDLQHAFPDGRDTDQNKLIDWAKHSLPREYGVEDAFIRSLNGIDPLRDFPFMVRNRAEFTPFEDFLWRYGIRYAYWVKRMPFISGIAGRIHSHLAEKRAIRWDHRPFRASAGSGEITRDNPGINIAGYITSESGTGEAVRANIRAIELTTIPHVLINLETQYRQEDKTYTRFSEDNIYNINYIHVNADQVPIFASQRGAEYFEGRYNIGFWVWELSQFPQKWLPCFRYYDEIWTPSSFCLDALSAVSPIPVIKIPHSVRINQIKEGGRPYFDLPEGSFVFLYMFDMLSYFERKNPLAVIDAFRRAFMPSDEVTLLLKLSNSERNPSARNRLIEAIKGLQVKIIDRYLYKDELHALMKLSDCFVSLHRSEGFGLPLAEAMYLHKPVIATGYSGNMDYMNINNSFLVKYNLIEIKEDVGPYKKGNVWADPDIDHAAELMQLVYHDRELAVNVGQLGAEGIKTHFSPSAVGKTIQQRIDLILSKLSYAA